MWPVYPAPFASIFQRCEGVDPITLYDAQRWLFMAKGWLPLPSESDPTDWPKIDQHLCEKYGWTPQQIDAMTLPEIRVARGRGDLSLSEKLNHQKLKEQLSIGDKLWAMQLANMP